MEHLSSLRAALFQSATKSSLPLSRGRNGGWILMPRLLRPRFVVVMCSCSNGSLRRPVGPTTGACRPIPPIPLCRTIRFLCCWWMTTGSPRSVTSLLPQSQGLLPLPRRGAFGVRGVLVPLAPRIGRAVRGYRRVLASPRPLVVCRIGSPRGALGRQLPRIMRVGFLLVLRLGRSVALRITRPTPCWPRCRRRRRRLIRLRRPVLDLLRWCALVCLLGRLARLSCLLRLLARIARPARRLPVPRRWPRPFRPWAQVFGLGPGLVVLLVVVRSLLRLARSLVRLFAWLMGTQVVPLMGDGA